MTFSPSCTDAVPFPGYGYHFVQALEHLNEATQSLAQFSESIFTYVDNNHTPFTIDQVDDLKEVHTSLS